jgi:lipopolysaccharide transport system permease protein
MMQAGAPTGFETVLAPGAQRRGYWRALLAHRSLFYHLAARDLRVRYKQTLLGLAWGLFRPLLSTGAFTLVFGMLGGFPTIGQTAYPIVVFCATLPWQLFATGVLHGSVSLTMNASLVTRVYFPRLLLPLSALINGLVDFAVGLVLLLIVLILVGQPPTWRLVTIPAFALLALTFSLGLGLWLSALNVRYRDFGYLAPFLLQLGFFLSPVGFLSTTVPEHWRVAYGLNPMVGAIDGFRWALLDPSGPLDLGVLAASVAVAIVTLVSGLAYFRRAELSFADRI